MSLRVLISNIAPNISFLTVFLSFSSMILSFLALWYSVLKRGRLAINIYNKKNIRFAGSGSWNAKIIRNYTIFNKGARPVAITELRTSLVNNPYPDRIRVDNSRYSINNPGMRPTSVFAPYSLKIYHLSFKFSDTNTMEFKVLEESGLQLQLTYGILGKDGFKNYKRHVPLKHLIKLLKGKVTEGHIVFKSLASNE